MKSHISKAMDLAAWEHRRQVRKYTGEPYIVHPFAVAGLVSSVTTDSDMRVAALLHDVVEDTQVTVEGIRVAFNSRVASLVSDLTDISRPEHGNRAERKALDRAHTAAAGNDAKTIKLADLIDNTKTIVAFDPNFAKVYMQEKRALLEVLKDGDPTLFALAERQIRAYFGEGEK